VVAPHWKVDIDDYLATVAEGRLVYVAGGHLRVRRVRDGVDRPLSAFPGVIKTVVSGSFGVAVVMKAPASVGRFRYQVYRIPWRLIDRTLTR